MSVGVREVDVGDVHVDALDVQAEELFDGVDHVGPDLLAERLDGVAELDDQRDGDGGDVGVDRDLDAVGDDFVHSLGLAGDAGDDLHDDVVADRGGATGAGGGPGCRGDNALRLVDDL